MKKYLGLFLTCIIMVILTFGNSYSKTSKPESNKSNKEDILRTIPLIDTRQTTLSNVLFNVTTNGTNAHDAPTGSQGTPGCYWPRDGKNSYIYGMGLCFATRKLVNTDTNKLVEISYNPSSAKSWLIPGRVEDGNPMIFGRKDKYQIYMSTDYNQTTGAPIDPADTLLWPLWKTDSHPTKRFGEYVYHNSYRTATDYPDGPAFISDEDMYCVFKDTDISRYEGDRDKNTALGFPLKMQYEEEIFSWDSPENKDMIIIMYKAINMSTDTLRDCWFGQIVDPDIVIKDNPDTTGMKNDEARYYITDKSLNLGITWSGKTAGESGKDLGYVGVSMLMSPAVDQNGQIRKDREIYPPEDQLGMKTFILFPITTDSIILGNLYDNVASEIKKMDLYPVDVRLLFSTGPFHLNPGDTARTAVLINFAPTASGNDADGSDEDCINLINGVKHARNFFYNNFLINSVNEEKSRTAQNASLNNLYPNPSNDIVSLVIESPKSCTADIEITDISGRILDSDQINLREGSLTYKMNTSSLNNGIYFVRIKSKDYSSSKILTVYR